MSEYIRSFLNLETASQFVKTGVVGVANTVLFFVVFNIARIAGVNLFWSITIAFAFATLLSYVLNRRWSFRLNDGGENVRETSRFFAINAIAWAITQALMWLADEWLGPLSRLGENFALLLISGVILFPKFATYRDVVFRLALNENDGEERAESPSNTA